MYTADDDQDDTDPFKRWVRIMNRSHGYGGVFNHETDEDKRIVEESTAFEWCDSVQTKYGINFKNLRSNEIDPPDCFVTVAGKELGLELVQFINQEHKRRASIDESPYAGKLFSDMQWSKERFEKELNACIQTKGAKYFKRNFTVDVLIVHTDETWLRSEETGAWLEECEISDHPNIGSAFLMHTYEPGRNAERWPVFWLFGNVSRMGKPR